MILFIENRFNYTIRQKKSCIGILKIFLSLFNIISLKRSLYDLKLVKEITFNCIFLMISNDLIKEHRENIISHDPWSIAFH